MEAYLKTNLECLVCHDIMREPQVLIGCLHKFCKACIERWMSENLAISTAGENDEVPCPYCRTETFPEDVKDDFNTRELIEVYKKEVKHNSSSQRHGDDVYTRQDQDAYFDKELYVLKSKIKERISRRRFTNAGDKRTLTGPSKIADVNGWRLSTELLRPCKPLPMK